MAEEKQGKWHPYHPVELGQAKLAFESAEEAQAFLDRCTTEGTLFTDDEGKTRAVMVVVFRENEKPEAVKEEEKTKD